MTEIFMIRHGQASFHGDDYDILSPMGIRQSQIVARHLFKAGIRADQVFCGTLKRHRETLQAMEEILPPHTPLPPAIFMDELNEYDHNALLRELLPLMIAEDPSLSDMLQKVRHEPAAFQRLFRMIVDRWLSGNYPPGALESWQDFSDRVLSAIDSIKEGNAGKIFIITSGGPISVVAGAALGLPPERTVPLGWEIANASISRFRLRSSGPVLAVFNAFGHLEAEEGCLTYR